MYDVNEFKDVKIIPILPFKNYPLTGADIPHFEENLDKLRLAFSEITY